MIVRSEQNLLEMKQEFRKQIIALREEHRKTEQALREFIRSMEGGNSNGHSKRRVN